MTTEKLQVMESRIIEAAKRVFVRKVYEATKMGDIALEVGISRTVMRYSLKAIPVNSRTFYRNGRLLSQMS